MLDGFCDDPRFPCHLTTGTISLFWTDDETGSARHSDFSVSHIGGRRASLDPRLIPNPQLFPPNVPKETKVLLCISFTILNYKVCLQNLKYFPINFFLPFPSGSPTSPPIQASLPSSGWSPSEEGGREPSSNSLARHLGKLLSPSVLSFSTIKRE